MKYIVLVNEGMADDPLPALSGRTPLEAAKTPAMDALVKKGRIGTASFVPARLPVSPDIAVLSYLGYDPEEFYTGIAPLEAAAMGISQSDHEIVFRCDLVTVFDDILVDTSASRITPRESHILIEELQRKLGSDRIRFFPGVGYKNILRIHDPELVDALDEVDSQIPEKIMGQRFSKHLPSGRASEILTDLMDQSKEILDQHEINRVRIDLGENPANMIWPWGQGKRPKLPTLKSRIAIAAHYFSDADFLKGLGHLAALSPVATLDEGLMKADFLFVYRASGQADGRTLDLKTKIRNIEDFDSGLVAKAAKWLQDHPMHRILVGSDFLSSVEKRRFLHGRVPFLIAGEGIVPDNAESFDEKTASQSKFLIDEGHHLLDMFLNKTFDKEKTR